MSAEKSNDIEASAITPAVREADAVSDLKHEQEHRHVGDLTRQLKSRHIQFLVSDPICSVFCI